ncbi:MAG: ATP-dependent RecD-like DNA helicase [Bacilli bacterium]|nr:ATP-dependent RecD-like DNA helicase [Bacilli bacterium]
MKKYIKGKYRKSIYENDNGYKIGLFKVVETNHEDVEDYLDRIITFTGYFHELNDMDTYMFYGDLVNHPKYGEQFNVESYDRVKPDEKESIIEFLTSGLFKGIGEKKAKKIYDTLGKDTFNIILNNPNNLLLIPTITQKNVDTLHNKLKEYESSYEIIIYLNELGFNTKDSMSIYNYYKNDTKSIIEKDIYRLVKDINELNFKKIDYIALQSGIKKLDIIRVKASILYLMNEISNLYGHSYIFKDEIINTLPRVLLERIEDDLVNNALISLEKNLDIVKVNDKYYLRDMYDSEVLISKRIKVLNNKEIIKVNNINDEIDLLEKDLNIKYNTDQIKAIKESIKNNFLIITGGPGTGKTTIMKGIVELYRNVNKLSYKNLLEDIALLAPTGRAAKRMSEATNTPASTIHRFLKWNKETNKYQVNEYNKSKVKLVIIDESSMIDTYLFANLLKGISSSCRIIMVGDYFQLPSVGPGQLLHDLITSDILNVVELKKLYRQEKDSDILSLAYDIRNGELNKSILNKNSDLTFIECSNDEVMSNIIEISNTYKDLSYKDFQILAPMYKTINGIDNININLQKLYNKKSNSKKEISIGETIYREGDKVIELSNMPDENIYNGDIGIINLIKTKPKKEIYIDFDDNIVKFTPANFNKFKLAYSISIHKAQGSEFDVVVIPLVRNFNKMLYRKLIYTAVTRCKKSLYLVGDINALNIAINNNSSEIRRTTIKDLLINE